ncbi:sensor histidine kinase [Gracilimonas sp. BCB1]|uniref:sensor histidine kinase n=1 Tax=Gracilimonas sp. BCB1 TaxID=3152362 RepID=UPI0032D9245D
MANLNLESPSSENTIVSLYLDLIHQISKLDEHHLSIPDLLHKATNLIPDTWDETDQVAVQLSFNNASYQSGDDPKSGLSHTFSSDINLSEFRLSVKKNNVDFNKQESSLIDTIGTLITSKIERMLSAKSIEENERLLDKAYQLAHIGTWEYDMINHELHWSDITKQVHGFESDYKPDVESTIQLFKEGFHRDNFAKAAYDAIEHQVPFDLELKIISGKGDERWIRATGEPEYVNGQCIRFYGISQNVTDRRKAEEDLELNERRFKALVQHGMDMIAIFDEDANYKYVSPASNNVLNLPPAFFIGKNAFDLIHEDDKDRIYSLYNSLGVNESIRIEPFRFLNANEEWRWLEATATNLCDDPAVQGYVVNSRDVTERHVKHEQIVESLKKKETLLAEIHHRIKNNLSVLTTMLELQASDEQNEAVLNRLIDSIARIHTMASIHEQLYQSENYAELDFSDRIKLLATNIKKTLQTQAKVDLIFRCEPLHISVDHALACSLVVNEVLTNIFKHAFKDREEGRIVLELNPSPGESNPHLKISDDGVGLPKGFQASGSESLGLSLIDMLSDQIAETYSFSSKNKGTVFELTFNQGILNQS